MEKKSSIPMAALFVDEEEDYDFLELSEEDTEDLDASLALYFSLSHWEFISASDFDSEEETKEVKPEQVHEQDEDKGQIESQEDLHFLDDHHDSYDYDHDDDHDDIDDDDDAYDLNDELVPWSVSGKLGRQRMRKLGKRGFTKMYNSKKPPYLFMRPGAVRGKHGLGLKHSF